MPTPASITFKTVHGQILALDSSGTPATGAVRFESPTAVRDTADNLVFGPTVIDVALDANGEFTVALAATNDTDLDPTGWMWKATVNTNLSREIYFLTIDIAGPTPIEFADVITTTEPPGFNTYNQSEVDALLALRVAKSGDTMTGDLTLSGSSTDITVGGMVTGTFGSVTGNYLEMVAAGLSTGTLFGGEINVNGSNPQAIDIAPFTGYIVDTITAQGMPSLTRIVTTATTTVVLTAASLARLVTWFLMDSAGVITQQGTRPTNTQRRTHLQLGVVVYESTTGAILIDQTLPVTQMHPISQLYDLMYALGTFNVSGNVVSASAANLTFAKTSGVLFAPSFNYYAGATPTNDPHVSSLAAQNPVSFRHLTQSTTAPVLGTTILDVGNYDLNGVITPVGGGVNTSTIFRVFAVATNAAVDQVVVQYGQAVYNSLAEAQTALGSERFIVHPGLVESAALIGHITAIRTATDLTNTAQALFHTVGKFTVA